MSASHLVSGDRKRVEHEDSGRDTAGSKLQKAPPPAYTEDPPDITAAFSNLGLDKRADKPTVDECVAHLKLLEAFSQLREDVGTNDGLYGIKDDFASSMPTGAQIEALSKMREKRWAVYVTKAVNRFEMYWKRCIQPDARLLRQTDLELPHFEAVVERDAALDFGQKSLPPLDVLLVWHSYMLNPRSFLADCVRVGKMKLWATGMPWGVVNASIDNVTFEYQPGDEARRQFESQTGHPWDNLDEQPFTVFSCPRCRRELKNPWTTCTSKQVWDSNTPGEAGWGFADPGFLARCAYCALVVNHDILRAQKFRNDMQNLILKDCPMPGTFLNMDGLPKTTRLSTSSHWVSFPNRLIAAGLSTKILEATDMKQQNSASMNDIRIIIETGLKDAETLKKAAGASRVRNPVREERIAIRRMMSSYWDNSSPFALDLVGAVIRQSSFIEKMHSIDWIHSPALISTMSRLITKYERYFQILENYPQKVAVPTLDVDLAWHTHQLSPRSYFRYSVFKTAKFIDHDDKIEDSKLSTAFEWTSKTYQKMFNSVYSECTCWYCEAIRESHTSTISRIFKSSKDPVSNELDRMYESPAKFCDPGKAAHISAHNAVKNPTATAAVRTAELERNYQRACQRARKKGREPPARDMSYNYWGYPMMMSYYAPYMGYYPYAGSLYVSNPACANFETGGVGNCCQGSCGGAVAAGSCAQGACGGSSSVGGGCAGFSGGGCSGGGGGGGGGCGGGGGGGC